MPEIVKKNPVNEPTQKPVKTHSKFTPNYSLYATHQFGVNSPFYVSEGVSDDDIQLRTNIDTDTFTLKAPLMQPVKRAVDYFQVPFRAIMPETAELLITNPLRGDDVVANNVTPNISRYTLFQLLSQLFDRNATAVQGINNVLNGNGYQAGKIGALTGSAYVADASGRVFRFIQFMNLLFSKGSLVNHLGINFHKQVRVRFLTGVKQITYDDFVDQFFAWFVSMFTDDPDSSPSFTANFARLSSTGSAGSPYTVVFDPVVVSIRDVSSNSISLRDFVGLLNEGRLLASVTNFIGLKPSIDAEETVVTRVEFPLGVPTFEAVTMTATSKRVNLLRLAAYQIACAEFYTSDTVDDVYSARLYHQNMRSLMNFYVNNTVSQASDFLARTTFTYNGIRINYDVFAGYIIGNMLGVAGGAYNPYLVFSNITPAYVAHYGYFHNLFGFQRSLKFQDYFVGARTRPLAVGDVSVGVDTGSNTVDVVDISKNIQVQRFLNQVNRVGRKFSEYVRGILGDKPMPDAHDPIFLGHVVDTIGAEETANTGDAQYSNNSGITSKFRSNANRYGFEVHVAEPSILVGILNYDIPRVYSSVTDREVYHLDRYEFFNPYMQFVGDQEVFADELQPGADGNFAYQIRYAEYRQRVDRAVGGFDGYLPGYAKVVDSDDLRNIYTRQLTLGSDFIRSRMSDIDEFYLNLIGYSLATYFHFIDRVDMSVTARRPMAFAPSIL